MVGNSFHQVLWICYPTAFLPLYDEKLTVDFIGVPLYKLFFSWWFQGFLLPLDFQHFYYNVSLWKRAWQPTPEFFPGESPWTEEPSGLQYMGLQSVNSVNNWATKRKSLFLLEFVEVPKHTDLYFSINLGRFQPLFLQIFFSAPYPLLGFPSGSDGKVSANEVHSLRDAELSVLWPGSPPRQTLWAMTLKLVVGTGAHFWLTTQCWDLNTWWSWGSVAWSLLNIPVPVCNCYLKS